LVLFLDQPLTVEGKERDRLDVEVFGFDPSLAPNGKTVIKVVMDSSYDYWKELSLSPEKYRQEKQKVAELIAERLDKRFPNLKDHIEAVDGLRPFR
jgi:phytoene dehydrogenase-like protein